MSKSNMYCSVPGCKSWARKNPEISFHRFPLEGTGRVCMENRIGNKDLIDRRKAWVLTLKINKPITKYMCVCSRHFQKNDYFGFDKNKKYLKKTAVPSQYLPETIQKHDNATNLGQYTNNDELDELNHKVELTAEDFEAAELLCLLKGHKKKSMKNSPASAPNQISSPY